jgi:hypothetical protein
MTTPTLLLEVPPDAATLRAGLVGLLDRAELDGSARVVAAGLDGRTGVQVTVVTFPSATRKVAFQDRLAGLVTAGLVIRCLSDSRQEPAGLGLLFP